MAVQNAGRLTRAAAFEYSTAPSARLQCLEYQHRARDMETVLMYNTTVAKIPLMVRVEGPSFDHPILHHAACGGGRKAVPS